MKTLLLKLIKPTFLVFITLLKNKNITEKKILQSILSIIVIEKLVNILSGQGFQYLLLLHTPAT